MSHRPIRRGEVHHPQAGEFILVAESETVAELQAKFAELLSCLHGVTAHQQEKVTGFRTGTFSPCLELFGSIEFPDAALDAAVLLEFHPHQALGAYLRTLHEFCQFIYLLAGVSCATLGEDANCELCVVYYRESVALCEVCKFHKLHAEAKIGFVAAVETHSVIPCHARERFCEVYSLHIFEYVLHETFEHPDHVFLLHETHLAVDLREFGLAVGAEVFITEALCDLEIAVVARHHQ